MYKSTAQSTSSQSSMEASHGGGLTRYGSAPGSFLTTAVDSVIGTHPSSAAAIRSQQTLVNPYFSSGDSSVESSSKIIFAGGSNDPKSMASKGLQRSYGIHELALGDLNGIEGGSSSSSAAASLMRQRSSPAGFFTHLTARDSLSASRETGNYNSLRGPNGLGVSRLKPQLSFTRQDSLSQMSEVSENIIDGVNSSNGISSNACHSYGNTTSFGIGSWDTTNTIEFSAPQNRQPKNIDADMFGCLNVLDSQFSLPTNLQMAAAERLLHIPEDSVPCKIRAKRGCATHPRSIAERERRTRISGKLKKLEELVPNMDKQTSYADMLDLAVQHIKGLQNQIQNLNKDLENCSCGCQQSA